MQTTINNMNKIEFSIEIHTSAEKVWNTLWEDKTFREWSNIIDEGTYMKGELREGGEIEFISGNSGYGVTSLVEKLIPGEFLLLRHKADTQDVGARERASEWTGGAETYSLSQKGDLTILSTVFDVPATQEEYFRNTYPKALAKIKLLAENN